MKSIKVHQNLFSMDSTDFIFYHIAINMPLSPSMTQSLVKEEVGSICEFALLFVLHAFLMGQKLNYRAIL